MEAEVKKKPKQPKPLPKPAEDREAEKEPSASNDEQSDSNTKEQDVNSENRFSWSCENLTDTTVVKVERRGLAGLFRRSASTDNLFDEMCVQESNMGADMKLSVSWENLLEAATSKVNTGRLAGIFKKALKPASRSIATEDPLSSMKDLSASWDSLADAAEEGLSAYSELSAGNNLSDATSVTKENKGVFAGVFRRTSKTREQQEREDVEAPEAGECRKTIKKKIRVVSFRIKKTLPKIPKLTLSSQTSDKMPVVEENVELGELNPAQESTVEVQPVEIAAYPSENDPPESEPDQESDELMEWWNTVEGWTEWNEISNFQEEDEDMAVEQAADRVYLAARLFVRLFNQRGASLQHRILELLSLADAADQFHKKTVSAAVGGGVASVAGSVATITGLILAPFTFGASVIVTAVGISVATAGGLTSATANITDTVHSRMDRKKVEKMIQGYQEEIKDIRECLVFVQEGIDTLQEWDFEQYSQSAAKKALNHSVKTVLKEGGRAGKALLINTEKLISTVQILGAAGGAVRAAKVMSVTTGVMSGLFLALDVFFLAKDSHELRKGAKTQFAAKVREVCKELQDGLLDLNKVKTQLQKTMDGIEVEEYEEIEEEVVEIEDDLEWDPKKLAELEKELDLLEEKLDKKVEEEQKKSKEAEKEYLMSKEKIMKEEEELIKEGKKESKKEKGEVEGKLESKIEKQADVLSVKSAKEAVKEQSQKGSKQNKETKKQKEKCESKEDKTKKDTGTNGKVNLERVNTEKEKQRGIGSTEDVRGMKPEWRPVNKEKRVEGASTRRHSSRSDREDREGGSQHEMRETDKKRSSSIRDAERLVRKEGNRTESWGRAEEEKTVKNWRAEMAAKEERESKIETEMKRDCGKSDTRKESNHSCETASRWENMEKERRSSTEGSDSKRNRYRRAMALHDERRETGDEKRATRVKSMRKQFEREAGEEEVERDKREDGEGARGDREHEHSLRGYRPRSNALLGDGP